MDLSGNNEELEEILRPDTSKTAEKIFHRKRRSTHLSYHDPSEFIETQRPFVEFPALTPLNANSNSLSVGGFSLSARSMSCERIDVGRLIPPGFSTCNRFRSGSVDSKGLHSISLRGGCLNSSTESRLGDEDASKDGVGANPNVDAWKWLSFPVTEIQIHDENHEHSTTATETMDAGYDVSVLSGFVTESPDCEETLRRNNCLKGDIQRQAADEECNQFLRNDVGNSQKLCHSQTETSNSNSNTSVGTNKRERFADDGNEGKPNLAHFGINSNSEASTQVVTKVEVTDAPDHNYFTTENCTASIEHQRDPIHVSCSKSSGILSDWLNPGTSLGEEKHPSHGNYLVSEEDNIPENSVLAGVSRVSEDNISLMTSSAVSLGSVEFHGTLTDDDTLWKSNDEDDEDDDEFWNY